MWLKISDFLFVLQQVRFFGYSDLENVKPLSSGNFGVTYRGELIDGNTKLDIVAKVSKTGAGEDEWIEIEVGVWSF
jgi:hypothetical protein